MQDDIDEVAVKIDEVAVKKAAYAILRKQMTVGSDLAREYALRNRLFQAHDLSPLDDPKHIHAAESFLRQKAEELIAEGRRRVSSISVSESGEIEAWRAIVVPREWVPEELETGPLGTSWSHEIFSAISHEGALKDDMIEVRLRGMVDEESVDWQTTMLLNSVDTAVYGREDELRLRPDAAVRLLTVTDVATEAVLADFGDDGIRIMAGLAPDLGGSVRETIAATRCNSL